jgi:hypothetical protein
MATLPDAARGDWAWSFLTRCVRRVLRLAQYGGGRRGLADAVYGRPWTETTTRKRRSRPIFRTAVRPPVRHARCAAAAIRGRSPKTRFDRPALQRVDVLGEDVDYGKRAMSPHAHRQAPVYASSGAGGSSTSFGGLLIDTKMRASEQGSETVHALLRGNVFRRLLRRRLSPAFKREQPRAALSGARRRGGPFQAVKLRFATKRLSIAGWSFYMKR